MKAQVCELARVLGEVSAWPWAPACLSEWALGLRWGLPLQWGRASKLGTGYALAMLLGLDMACE